MLIDRMLLISSKAALALCLLAAVIGCNRSCGRGRFVMYWNPQDAQSGILVDSRTGRVWRFTDVNGYYHFTTVPVDGITNGGNPTLPAGPADH